MGQDSHRFSKQNDKTCILGGVIIPESKGFEADSDGDVILHSICNAITSVFHVPILGKVAIEMCHQLKIADSRRYVEEALKTIRGYKINHVAISLEGSQPRLQSMIDLIRESISLILKIEKNSVGITITSGNHLTKFSEGEGLQSFCLITFLKD